MEGNEFQHKFETFFRDENACRGLVLSIRRYAAQFHSSFEPGEILSETYLRGLNYLQKKPDTVILNLEVWLKRIAFNIIRESVRSEKQASSLRKRLDIEPQRLLDSSDPRESVLEDAKKELTEQELKLIELHYAEGLSWSEVSTYFSEQGTEISVSALRKRGSRAMMHLKNIVLERMEGDSFFDGSETLEAEEKDIAEKALTLDIQVSDNSALYGGVIAEEIASLCKALNAYHIACGGNGLEIDDWETLVAIREVVEI